MKNTISLQTAIAIPGTRHAESLSSVWLAFGEVLAVTGAMAIAAWIRIPLPFSPVPLTMQTLVVLLAPFLVGPCRSSMAMALYVGLGLSGIPILTQPFGPTFGYLIAFMAIPWLVSRFSNTATAMLAGTCLIYALGAAWLAFWMRLSPMCFFPMKFRISGSTAFLT